MMNEELVIQEFKPKSGPFKHLEGWWCAGIVWDGWWWAAWITKQGTTRSPRPADFDILFSTKEEAEIAAAKYQLKNG